jgi:LPS export ABC transporter protein LptC
MKLTDKIRYFSIAALLSGCFFVLPSCENDPVEVENLYKKKTGVEEGKQVESYLSQGGKVKAKLTAPYMLRYQADSPYIEFPRTVHVDFYNDSTAQIESTVDARYAKYVEFERKVLLRDSVRVVSLKNGDRLLTKQLWWDQNTQEFYTSDTTYIFQTDKTIVARKGLRAAQNLTRYTFYDANGPMLLPKSGIPE